MPEGKVSLAATLRNILWRRPKRRDAAARTCAWERFCLCIATQSMARAGLLWRCPQGLRSLRTPQPSATTRRLSSRRVNEDEVDCVASDGKHPTGPEVRCLEIRPLTLLQPGSHAARSHPPTASLFSTAGWHREAASDAQPSRHHAKWWLFSHHVRSPS